ncbi:unnamed protein product [Closterium sp. Naga37s-1]|nr:unnamed protein product [Closterium sp. Naga37s-1]
MVGMAGWTAEASPAATPGLSTALISQSAVAVTDWAGVGGTTAVVAAAGTVVAAAPLAATPLSRNWRAGAWGVQRGASLLYRIACWLSLSRCFCHVLGTALAASASAPPALRRAAACIMANPQAAAPAPPAVAAAQKGLSLSSAVPAAVEGAWRGSLAQCCCFSGSLILALNAAGARWGPEGQGDVGEWE